MSLEVAERSIPHQYRLERYIELGFDEYQAELLANAHTVEWAKDAKGNPKKWYPVLYWGRVANALEAGCSHELAVEIFT